jgi:hypothetical protein
MVPGRSGEQDTWGIEIRFVDTGEEVTAVARLNGGPSSAVGLGSARHDAVREPALRAALAARRSLGALSESLDYLVQVGVHDGRVRDLEERAPRTGPAERVASGSAYCEQVVRIPKVG